MKKFLLVVSILISGKILQAQTDSYKVNGHWYSSSSSGSTTNPTPTHFPSYKPTYHYHDKNYKHSSSPNADSTMEVGKMKGKDILKIIGFCLGVTLIANGIGMLLGKVD